jgi:D-glycero-alpha-D-manno-heptose 1-phosphate guanylyltransferase
MAPFDAVILAGGFGTRLQSVVKELPKPMAPVNGRPFMAYLLDYIANSGVRNVVVSTGYLGNTIQEFFQGDYRGMKLLYAHEDQPLGTGGGIRFAMEKTNSDHVLVLNGDTFFALDISEFLAAHLLRQASVSIALKQTEDVSRYGSVEINQDSRIIRFAEKNAVSGEGLINAGAYFIDHTFFKRNSFAQRFSMEKDALETLYPTEHFYGFTGGDYFIDIGIPEDYERAQRELKHLAL